MVKNSSQGNSIINQYIAEIRDSVIQTDSMRFRYNLERMSEIFGYEISKTLEYESREVITPLGSAEVPVLKKLPGNHSGSAWRITNASGTAYIFDKSESAFISAYRKSRKK